MSEPCCWLSKHVRPRSLEPSRPLRLWFRRPPRLQPPYRRPLWLQPRRLHRQPLHLQPFRPRPLRPNLRIRRWRPPRPRPPEHPRPPNSGRHCDNASPVETIARSASGPVVRIEAPTSSLEQRGTGWRPGSALIISSESIPSKHHRRTRIEWRLHYGRSMAGLHGLPAQGGSGIYRVRYQAET